MDKLAVTSLLLGLLATTSPCILPLYPGFLAYLGSQNEMGRQKYFLGLFVLAGVLTMMIALGGLIALLSIPIGSILLYIIPLADLLIFLLGILLLLNHNPFKTLPQIQTPVFRHPYGNAYVYGLLYGPIALPCSGPLVVGIFALSFTAREAFSQLWTFLWFGLGLGMPLLILSFLSAALQRRLTALFARHSRIVNFIGGLFLVGVAVYDLAKNWKLLLIFYKS
ncbi:MAG: cytochrome c biogenesis protein CcdA [Chloroflexi bacterium]|nr:cytochrome c biogenesis protein CcdA [Chloroflexota bacterium]